MATYRNIYMHMKEMVNNGIKRDYSFLFSTIPQLACTSLFPFIFESKIKIISYSKLSRLCDIKSRCLGIYADS
jgi:hypothetical protein